MKKQKNDIIAAIATGTGGAMAVVRLSGEGTIKLADQIFQSSADKKPSSMKGYTAAYGYVVENGEKVDEVVLTVFRAPLSYTGENMVEISCHGGAYLPGRVLSACIDVGARPAGPGEFSKRAFLNGKLDLIQAEAVAALIGSEGERAAKLALSMMDDALGKQVRSISSELISMAGRIAAWLDYPEEDMEDVTLEWFCGLTGSLIRRIEILTSGYQKNKLIRRGIDIAIIGRPNVGKSTLMNLLLGEERSIVTEIPGTTRDVVEGELELDGVRVRLYDTAGLRESHDPVEKIGVERARRRLEQCDLALIIFDGSDKLTEEDRTLVATVSKQPALAVINKADLPQSTDMDYIRELVPDCLSISAKHGQGREELRKAILNKVGLAFIDPDATLVAQERQYDCLMRSASSLSQAIAAAEAGTSFDALCVLIEDAIAPLLELTGERVSDAVVNELFSKFCVGK